MFVRERGEATLHLVSSPTPAHKERVVESPAITAIEKLVLAGEQAGFTVEQMIQILQTGASVEALLHMIESRLSPVAPSSSSRWVM